MEYASTTTLNAIRKADPCTDGWTKLLKHLGKSKADDEPLPLLTVLDSNGLDDALWVLTHAMPDDKLARHFQAWIADQLLPSFEAERPDDMRIRNQIAMLRNDSATDDERDEARDAAWDAAWDTERDAAWAAVSDEASGEAWNAAWAAVRDAVSDAAWDAARSAARSAAGNAASAAVSDAVSDAAWDAARSAARDEAGDEAGAAARDAARAAQEAQLRKMIGETE